MNVAVRPPITAGMGVLRKGGRGLRQRVVILGAGFAGLAAARALGKAPVEVTVIDRRNYHLFQPLLYQVATAQMSDATEYQANGEAATRLPSHSLRMTRTRPPRSRSPEPG
jgi:2-polyprenyl-6-methoxyphenol hydroxylase-like FAD-dependent oxidoreductase